MRCGEAAYIDYRMKWMVLIWHCAADITGTPKKLEAFKLAA
jgi:hypothetical protein